MLKKWNKMVARALNTPASAPGRKQRPRHFAPRVEALETREVLTVSAALNAGVLRVVSDSASDNVNIERNALLDIITVRDNLHPNGTFTFSLAAAQRIEVDM